MRWRPKVMGWQGGLGSCLLGLLAGTGWAAQDGPLGGASPGASPYGPLQSPGMPRIHWGQTSRFSSAFNPAFGIAVDGAASIADVGAENGAALALSVAELTGQAAISPSWWGNFALETNAEEVALSEAVLTATGLGERTSVRFGRMFLDFGKQMQIHVHDLASPERPAALREFLGSEAAGTGVEWNRWWPVGEDTALRCSVGLFGAVEGAEHGSLLSPEDDDGEVQAAFAERGTARDFVWTARCTAMTDVGERGVLQAGASVRAMPRFGFFGGEDDQGQVLTLSDQRSRLFGADLTYGWASDDGMQTFTGTLEALLAQGDLAASVRNDGMANASLEVFDDRARGLSLSLDHGWNRQDSIGLVLSTFEHPEVGTPRDSEWTLYWNHYATEFLRVRLAAVHLQSGAGEDRSALLVQLTGYMGAHGHPYNW